jgi:hypothetical protein
MEKTVKAETKVNYRSDFDLYMTLADCRGTDLGWPEWDWTAKFYTSTKFTTYTASCIGGVCTNCFNDNGKIHVVFDNHRLPEGTLNVEFAALLPEGIFPDGDRKVSVPAALAVMLTREAAPCPSSVEVDMLLPFVKGKWEDLTPEEIAELQRPATEAAEELRQDMTALEKTLDENEKVRIENEAERQREENTRRESESVRTAHESERQTAERNRQTAETERGKQEDIRVSNENARVEAENKRAETFSGWETELDSKAGREELSNIVGVPAEEEIEDLEPGIMATLLRKVPQVLTPEEQAQVKENIGGVRDVIINMWNAACRYKTDNGYVQVGRYNENTGFFELNGITDITYEQAVEILLNPPKWVNNGAFSDFLCQYTNSAIRTHLPLDIKNNYGVTLNSCFHSSLVESIDLPSARIKGSMGCRLLHTLKVSVIMDSCTGAMPALMNFAYYDSPFPRPRVNKDFRQSSLLTSQSVVNLINGESADEQNVVYTVHPDVYAKLTDAGNAEWHKVLTDAADKNITFATV